MKKFLLPALTLLLIAAGCEKYDDSALREELLRLQQEQEAQKGRLTSIETWQLTVNSNIGALHDIVEALQANDYVTSVDSFATPSPGGYRINFTKSPSATIWNGAKGNAGSNGDVPQVSVEVEGDEYYWTVNGEWLTDDEGHKIPVTGGEDIPIIVPQLRINTATNKWEVCTNGGCTDEDDCTSTGVEATGPQGDAIFAQNGVDNTHPTYVEFTLADGAKIKVQRYSESPRFLTFDFKAAGNPLGLAYNVACTVEENAIVIVVPHVEIPHLLQKKWVPNFTFEGAAVLIGDSVQESGRDSVDFSAPVEYTVQNQSGRSTTYTVKVLSYTGLPIVSVNTKDNAPILSKDDYVEGDVRILGDMATPIFSGTMRIKGRGNATWGYEKRPYRIKLDEKSEMLGMPADKDWVLLAEYTDKSLLRHTYGFELSKLAGLPWTPRYRHVEFFRNGAYQGTYYFGEHVKVAKDRVDAKKDGFLIEWVGDWNLDPLYFRTTDRGFYYVFKHPDPDDEISQGDASYNYILNLMNEFEAALYSADFTNPETGYQKYIDVNSFVSWFLVQETLGNPDPNFYLVLESRSDKLKIYPAWDFEWSLGLAAWSFNSDVWAKPPATAQVTQLYWKNRDVYYGQLFKDPYFVGLVKEQWPYMKSAWLSALEKKVDEEKELIRYAQKENFERWSLLGQYISHGLVKFATWEEETVYAKEFLRKRVAWLDAQIASW
jgi:hypothetical protein